MKKLLSVVLALAIVASSLIVFGAMATAASAEPKAVKATLTTACASAKNQIVFKAPFLSAADFGDKDTLELTFVLTNLTDKETLFSFQAQEDGSWRDKLYASKDVDAEGKPTGELLGRSDAIKVPANGAAEFKITLPKTGYFYHSNAAIGFASEEYFSKLCIRIYFNGETEIPVGSAVEMAIKDNDALNEKFVNSAVDTTWMNGVATAAKLDAATMSAATKNVLTATPTPAATPTPSTPFTLVNGDVSIGNVGDKTVEGWLTWQGGTNEIVADPSNANNKVIKFVPTGMYSTTGFRASAVVYNDGGRYTGAGAAEYEISFRARLVDPIPEGADAAKAGRFTVALCGTKIAHYDSANQNTYSVSGGNVDLTTEWQTFTTTVKVEEKNYATWTDIAKDAENIFVRLDGSGANRALGYTGAYAPVAYYIDDVTVAVKGAQTTAPAGTLAPGATATPTPTPAPTPNAIEIHALQNTTYYINSVAGVMDANDIKDGVLKKEITVENVGENDITVQLCIQATVKNAEGKDTWQGFANEGGYVEIAAGEKETIAIEVEFDGNVTTILDQEVPVEKLFFRLNFNNNTTLNEGDGVLVYGDQDLIAGLLSKTSSDKLTFATKTIAIKGSSNPSNTGDVLPVALIATLAVATVALVVVAKKRKEN